MRISTTRHRLKRRVSISLRIFALSLALVALWASSFPMTNIARTSPNAADSLLRTRFYLAPAKDIARVVQNAVPQLKTYGRQWQVLETTQQNGTTTIRCQVPVLVFTDDLTVSLQETSGRTHLDVHSQSRVGKGDFGENRRHIRQFLQHLDTLLPTADAPQSSPPGK